MQLGAEIRKRAAAAVLILPVAAASFAAVRASSPDVAYIYSYEGAAANYSVLRAGRAIPVAPFLPLRTGDRITVNAPADRQGRKLTLVLSVGGQHRQVTAASSPLCIGVKTAGCNSNVTIDTAASNPVMTVLKNVLSSIAPIFGEAQEDSYTTQQDAMTGHRATAVEPPALPMLPESPRARTNVQMSRLAFAWLAGKAPFTAELSGGRNCAAKKTAILETSVVFYNVQVAPGTSCRLKIEDAGHHSVTGTFDVVGSAALPKLAVDQVMNDPALPAGLRGNAAAIRAAELAGQGVQWYLAAYQIVAAAPDDPEHRVQQLRSWLAEGLPASGQ